MRRIAFFGADGCRRALLIALAIAPSTLTGCTSFKLFAANVPARFGAYHAQLDIPYGAGKQTLDVYRANRVSSAAREASRPVVVFVHGGRWTSGSKDEYRFVAEALASRGFAVVVPAYRLYPETRFPGFVEDIAQAVAWTHEHAAEFDGDPQRLFLMGHSAGAQIAALIAFDASYLRQVGGDRSWVRGFVGLAGPYDILPFKEAYLHEVFAPESQFAVSQPVNAVDAQAAPTLLIHGEADTVVWPYNSKSLAARLRKYGVAVTERYYDGMSHTDVLAALSVYFRGREPILNEIEAFIQGRL